MAYLAKQCLGFSGAEALQWVRHSIPRAVETPAQLKRTPSSREQPYGDDEPLPVHQATEQVSHPLHPAIFVAQ